MEYFVKQCDKEFMKMALLKHEKTFRKQVNELHRLYRIQKQLMRDVRCTKELKRQRSSVLASNHKASRRRALNLQLSADEYIVRMEDEQEADLELTLALSYTGQKKGDMPLASGSSSTFSSFSTEYGTPLNRKGAALHCTDHFMVQPFDKITNTPWFAHQLSVRMT